MSCVEWKDGMVITLRNGSKSIFMHGLVYNFTKYYMGLKFSDGETLENWSQETLESLNSSKEDIVKIELGGELIWEKDFFLKEFFFKTKMSQNQNYSARVLEELTKVCWIASNGKVSTVEYDTKTVKENISKGIWEILKVN